MIEGLDIGNFGSFKSFCWDTVRNAKGEAVPFKTLNLLYGRNCSGKTTLSRILQTMETGALPLNYADPSFSIKTSVGSFTNAEIGTKQNVRVFNRDFVERHLSFLRRNDGTIESFAVVGAENREIEAQVARRTQELGSVDGKTGLIYEQENVAIAYTTANTASQEAAAALDALLSSKANNAPDGIKYRSKEFGDGAVSYNKSKLRDDLAVVLAGGDYRLNEADAHNLPILVGERTLSSQDAKVEFVSNFPIIATTATELLTRRVTPSAPLQDLLNDSILQSWVEMGMRLHRDKRTSCGFCQQPLPLDLWAKLDAHFNEASQALSLEIRACQEQIQQELLALEAVRPIPQETVYAVHRDEIGKLNEELNASVLRHRTTLNEISDALKIRSRKLFESQETPPPTPNYGNGIVSIGAAINTLVAKSNATTATLDELKIKARRRLLLAEVSKFAADIRYAEIIAANRGLAGRAEALLESLNRLRERTQSLQSDIQTLRGQLRDEGAAAERVNDFLQKHFGGRGLRLDSVRLDGASSIEFRVMRGTEVAHNLSDGECSLVAFCYFLAKLEDTDTNGTRPIVWIDDPISSLDSNHVFFLFSLIESQLARPEMNVTGMYVYRYEQLFISTHNLEFLKYLRRLIPKGQETKQLCHFIVVKRDTGSTVECMPDYLVKYTTEFNFLFGEIHTCVNPANQAANLSAFYNFGANLRRFLEAYLYFKFPFASGDTSEDFNKRIKQFFASGLGEDARVARMAHEGSHLLGAFDRALQPVESEEISAMARIIFTRLRDEDPEQYDALLKSVGKTCPL
jgi:wobble nucleotide-excising tRNase